MVPWQPPALGVDAKDATDATDATDAADAADAADATDAAASGEEVAPTLIESAGASCGANPYRVGWGSKSFKRVG